MSEADAFHDAIFATPDDDLPRLVYADWLEEHDQQAYAEFIRLQCEVARLPWHSPVATELWKRISPLWRRLEDEWWPIAWAISGIDPIHFHRGFYSGLLNIEFDEFPEQTWTCLGHSEAFFPQIRMRLCQDENINSQLLNHIYDSGLLKRCYSLTFAGYAPSEKDCREMPLGRIRVLNIAEAASTGPKELAALAANPSLASVRLIRFSHEWRVVKDQVLTLLKPFAERVEFEMDAFQSRWQ